METLTGSVPAWFWGVAGALASVMVVLGLYWLALRILRRLLRPEGIARMFLDNAARALGAVISLLVLQVLWQGVSEQTPLFAAVQQAITLALVVALTWAAVRCSAAVGDLIVHLYPPLEHQSRQARKVETQTRFITRGMNILFVIVGIAAALMTFPPVRQLGTSLLASAGIGGIILGFAARPVLSNLLAGMQIALTQPFRIDDVLYLEGEWCWVEEVTSTYVVLRVWDLRRLVMPLQWFIDHPFENWSRNSSNILGTVFLWVDYRMPVEPLREEFMRVLRASPQWDGQTSLVQVTDASDRAMQIRFLLGAPTSSLAWELRCHAREQLLGFVQRVYPEYLPRLRAVLEEGAPAAEGRPDGRELY